MEGHLPPTLPRPRVGVTVPGRTTKCDAWVSCDWTSHQIVEGEAWRRYDFSIHYHQQSMDRVQFLQVLWSLAHLLSLIKFKGRSDLVINSKLLEVRDSHYLAQCLTQHLAELMLNTCLLQEWKMNECVWKVLPWALAECQDRFLSYLSFQKLG